MKRKLYYTTLHILCIVTYWGHPWVHKEVINVSRPCTIVNVEAWIGVVVLDAVWVFIHQSNSSSINPSIHPSWCTGGCCLVPAGHPRHSCAGIGCWVIDLKGLKGIFLLDMWHSFCTLEQLLHRLLIHCTWTCIFLNFYFYTTYIYWRLKGVAWKFCMWSIFLWQPTHMQFYFIYFSFFPFFFSICRIVCTQCYKRDKN